MWVMTKRCQRPTMSNKNAIKMARAATGRAGVIAFTGGFHGRTLLTMGLTGKVAPYKAGFGPFPAERMNPNGGSVALGHPFGATGARIISMAVKELAARPKGNRAIVSICADGGLGSVLLLENA